MVNLMIRRIVVLMRYGLLVMMRQLGGHQPTTIATEHIKDHLATLAIWRFAHVPSRDVRKFGCIALIEAIMVVCIHIFMLCE